MLGVNNGSRRSGERSPLSGSFRQMVVFVLSQTFVAAVDWCNQVFTFDVAASLSFDRCQVKQHHAPGKYMTQSNAVILRQELRSLARGGFVIFLSVR